MSMTYTPNAKLARPGPADRNWNVPLNANADAIDALAPVGGLCVAPTEVPSATLRVRAAPGRFQRRDGTIGVFAGAPAIALAGGSTTYVYLDDAGQALTSTSGFPATSHVPLAIVVAGASAVADVTDVRVVCATVGSDSRPFLTPAGGVLNDGATFALGSTSGLKIGTSAAQKLGFWNAAPVARPGPYTQAYTSASRSLPAYTPSPASGGFAGIAAGQGGSPYAQAADLNNLQSAYENLRVFSENTTKLLNALINDLKAMGLLG
ncbi:hypothetical protein [Planctomyces sp. SH-PL62]|uniref:hypothetical protein n=1 Tax=Planctomyces sp. SH-PL62 TaxID=1636152 RepID=UPI00078EB924|nr:hypothetical protein [Planctomyces sp. SH-PL62]AMV37372.1 hypothetical protein VT85_08055 [Planctomyces sp. SH-PL62]